VPAAVPAAAAADRLPTIGRSDAKTSNAWEKAGEKFQPLEKQPKKFQSLETSAGCF
jgi:hypothetical protein